jgi:TolB-like protein
VTRVIEFGEFRFEPATPVLTRNARSVEIAPKALEILAVLVEHAGHVVTKDDLLSIVWPDEVVEEGNLAVYISALRKALGDSADRTAYIETVPKRGYRFAAPVSRPPSVAVLPFDSLGPDRENEYFGEGLAEEIINALSRVSGLKVIARTSAFSFKGKQDDVRRVGEILGVAHIVQGVIRTAGNRLRVTVRLIAAADAIQLWSHCYDREMADVFAIQEDIARAIANTLQVKLLGPRLPTQNLEAYRSYLKGLYHYRRMTSAGIEKAKKHFEQALMHDSCFARAHVGLADCYYIPTIPIHKPAAEARLLAKSALEKALTCDPDLSQAHCLAAMAATFVDYDWNVAEREFRIAMAVEPVPALVRHGYALWFLVPWRRCNEALEQCRLALETDPLSGILHFGFTYTLCLLGDLDGALAHAAAALEVCSNFWPMHFVIGLAQYQKGCVLDAIASLEQAFAVAPLYSATVGILAGCYLRVGKRSQSEQLTRSASAPISFAFYHAIIGDADRMFEDLEAALADRDIWMPHLATLQIMEPYRSDARFHSLLQRMNLE